MKNVTTFRSDACTSFYLLFISICLFSSHFMSAQSTGVTLYWDSQVGCLAYGEDKDKGGLLETIGEDGCVKTCEQNVVNYYLTGTQIVQAQWNVTGGTILSTSADGLHLTVHWLSVGEGSVGVEITLANQSVLYKSFCVEIITGPKAEFSIAGLDENYTFCAEVPLFFENMSHTNDGTQLIAFYWDFGDGTFSSAFEPSHVYMEQGNYTITLFVYNECFCLSKYAMEIIIDRPTLPISCPTVVCEGAIEIYSVEGAECELEWQVKGGQIINYPSSNSVQVIWDAVDDDGFGSLSVMSPCVCPFWSTVRIPVIKLNASIVGKTELCIPRQYRYKLPQWPGTFYEWTLISTSGQTTSSSVIQADQVNEAIVTASEPGSYILQCVYYNELVGCGGIATLPLDVNPYYPILGDLYLCQGSTSTYTTTNSTTIWTLTYQGAIEATGSGSTFTHLFSTPGTYVLKAKVPGNCDEQQVFITVFSTDVLPGTISGDDLVCSDVPYTYSFPVAGTNTINIWSVVGGTVQGSGTGTTASIVFDGTVPPSGYYEVIVEQQSAMEPHCQLSITTFLVYPKDFSIEIVNSDNTHEFCSSSFTTFSFDYQDMNEIEDISWRIESITGNTNYGNIVNGQGTPSIYVSWNEVSETPFGKVFVDVRFCGSLKTFEYEIVIKKNPEINFILATAETCTGNLSTFNMVVESDIPIENGIIHWDLGNGTIVPQIITNSSVIASPPLFYDSVLDQTITYTFTATLIQANGCNLSSSVSTLVQVKPSPLLSINSNSSLSLCPVNGQFSVELTANLQTGFTASSSVQWFKVVNGVPQPVTTGITNNGMNITITENEGFGQYFAQVIADNGCFTRTAPVFIRENCSPGTGSSPSCQFQNPPEIILSLINDSDCNTFSVQSNFIHHIPTQVTWSFANIAGITLDTFTNTSATFQITTPGNYLIRCQAVFLSDNNLSCVYTEEILVEIHFISDIRYELFCLGNSTFNLNIWDNSLHILPSDVLDDLQYTFLINGIAQQNPNNDPLFTTTSLSPGTYTLGLQLTHPSYPHLTQCIAETTITLFDDPNTNFTITHIPNCTEQVVVLTLDDYLPDNRYEWEFDNTSFVLSPGSSTGGLVTLINLSPSVPDIANVNLKITDPNGCVFQQSVSTSNVVSQAIYNNGFVSGGGSFCEGTTVELIYINEDNDFPISFQWMMGSQPIPGAVQSTFSPIQSGTYWLVLYNEYGCEYRRTSATSVTFYPAPQLQLHGPEAVCAHTNFTLRAHTGSGLNLEKRWLRNGVEIIGWSVNTSMSQVFNESVAGTYLYEIEIRDALTGACVTSASHEVIIKAVATLQVWYDLVQCSPYEVKLNVSSDMAGGIFVWSNGQRGDSIMVTAGGAYSVAYLAGNDCPVLQHLFVPKDPEIYLWLFPTGCIDLCKIQMESQIHLPAPNAPFYPYTWSLDDMVSLQGDEFSPPYLLPSEGSLALSLQNELTCEVISEPLYIQEIDCQPCDPRRVLRWGGVHTKPYLYHSISGYLTNNFGTDITVSISSPEGYGVFVPSQIYITAGSVYTFDPLEFIPGSAFSGGSLTIQFIIKDKDGKLICITQSIIETSSGRPLLAEEGRLVVVPNPVLESSTFVYDIGSTTDASLRVYDLLGIQRFEFAIHQSSGVVEFDMSALPTGNYIVVIFSEDQVLQQQLFVKK